MTKITLMADYGINSIFFTYEDRGDNTPFESVHIDRLDVHDLIKPEYYTEFYQVLKNSDALIDTFYLSTRLTGKDYDENVENYCNWLLELFAKKFYHLFRDDVELYVFDPAHRHNRRLIKKTAGNENHSETIQFDLSEAQGI